MLIERLRKLIFGGECIPPLTDKVVALADVEHTVLHYTGGRLNLGDLIRDASGDEGFSRGVGWS